MMTIYSDNLHWSGITPIFLPITDLDLITEFDFFPPAYSSLGANMIICSLRYNTLVYAHILQCIQNV